MLLRIMRSVTIAAILLSSLMCMPALATSSPPVTAGLIFAADADDVTLAKGGVQRLNDQSGHDNNAAQAHAERRPAVQTSATPSGLPALVFEGKQWLDIPPMPNDFDVKQLTWYVVYQSNGGDSLRAICSAYEDIDPTPTQTFSGQAWSTVVHSDDRRNSESMRIIARDAANGFKSTNISGADTTDFFIAGAVWDTTDSKGSNLKSMLIGADAMRKTNNTLTYGPAPNPVLSGHLVTRIGAGAHLTDRSKLSRPFAPFTGRITEILIYNRALSDAEREQVEGYLYSKTFGRKPETEDDPKEDESADSAHFSSDVYVSGEDGYNTYRIPSIVATNKGTLLASCEGRKWSRKDTGNIDLLLKRSTDGGRTWSPQQVLWDDGENTCGNPTTVVDKTTGTIWLLASWNSPQQRSTNTGYGDDSRQVYVLSSSDDGQTWTPPLNISRQVKLESWGWYATGPGAGIQLERGDHKGRLVIPCDHKEPTTDRGVLYHSHVIYSDDHGQTWQIGGSSPRDQVNECEVVELSDGRLMLNMRNADKNNQCRQIAFSDDGGESWHDQGFDPVLVEPICQASIRRFSWPENGKPGAILFSNPANVGRDVGLHLPAGRANMTVRLSYDDGATWRYARELYAGPAAYSCLVTIGDGRAGCLYEYGENPEKLVFEAMTLDWIESTPPPATN